jgi:hypothetical protein
VGVRGDVRTDVRNRMGVGCWAGVALAWLLVFTWPLLVFKGADAWSVEITWLVGPWVIVGIGMLARDSGRDRGDRRDVEH